MRRSNCAEISTTNDGTTLAYMEEYRILCGRCGSEYSSIYANVTPSFVVDISAQFERRMAALLSYRSQYGGDSEGGELFPQEQEIRERLGAVARFYGNLVGVKYGEPFVVKETMLVEDVVAMGGRSI